LLPKIDGLSAMRELREERGQEDRHPEQPGRDTLEDPTVGIEREREEQEHDQPERHHLLERHARPGFDAQVLRRHQPHLLHHVHEMT
jgi:hypothetical protein